ncbi:MAG: 4Fe-4S dicluster domain-containing protein, partial [Thermodesulfobacteriota bacterium]
CGACLNICPVYRKVGGHSYGWVYSGPIGAIITPQLQGLKKGSELPFASTLCGACKDVCPVKIDIPRVLLELRKRVVEGGAENRVGEGFFQKLGIKLWRLAMEKREIYEVLLSLSYFLQQIWGRDNHNMIKSLPYPFSSLTKHRDFPRVSRHPFRKRWKEIM